MLRILVQPAIIHHCRGLDLAGDPALGKTLGIRLAMQKFGDVSGAMVDFDNVRVFSNSVPEPSMVVVSMIAAVFALQRRRRA